MSASIKKRIWAGQYIDLSYLLETKPVPDDDKTYEFSCFNSNTNKHSLTTAKPKAKVALYNSWNKAFRVLMEIVALKLLDQCLPMVQYVAAISDNIGRFTFAATYNCDIKFRLKKQMKLALKWNEIDNSLWTKCFSRSGRDGYHASSIMPSSGLRNQTTEHAMTSTSPDVLDLSADSHINATSVSDMVTTNESAINSSPSGTSSLAPTPRVNIQSSNSSMNGQTQATTTRASQQ